MPVYSYICNDCGEKFDLLVGVTAQQEPMKCKKCNSENISKTIGAFNVGGGSGQTNGSGSSCPTGTCPFS